MDGLSIFTMFALVYFNQIRTVSSSGIEVIRTSLTRMGSSTEAILVGLMTSLQSQVNTLDNLADINQVINLLNDLKSGANDLATALQLANTNLFEEAVQSIFDAVNTISETILHVTPALDTLSETLGDRLQQVHSFFKQTGSFVVNSVSNSSSKLDAIVTNILSEFHNLGAILIDSLGNTLSTQLTNITNAVGFIFNFIQNNVLTKISDLTEDTLVKLVSFIDQLLLTKNLINRLCQGVIVHTFDLITQWKGAVQCLTGLIHDILISILEQLTNCVDCLTESSSIIGL